MATGLRELMNACIAVVEDDPDIRELMRDVLEAQGFAVIAISNPGRAQEASAAVQPDLFLVDLMLPGISGIELAKQLRASGFDDTPMIAMSASTLMLQVASDSRLFQDTVAKPFDLSAVIRCVHQYVA